jgi:hypothetical protein
MRPVRCSPNARSTAPPRKSPASAAAGRPRPCRRHRHRRRVAHQARRRQVPGRRQTRPLRAHGQGQPAHPPHPTARPALARGPGPGPHPRPRPRPRGDPQPQGRHRGRPRVPARHAGAADHSPDPRPATAALAHQGRVRRHRPARRQGKPRSSPISSEATGASRTACTTCATSPMPRTPPASAPGPPLAPWRRFATSPSASYAWSGSRTSPPAYDIPAAIPSGPSPY